MKKLKCPRCKSPIKENDTFCMSCGAPVREETKKENAKRNVEEERKENVIIVEEKLEAKQKKNIILPIILIVIILILLAVICYFLFFKEEKKCDECNCPKPEIKYIEKEPTIQYINFNGYRFSMPLDWMFEGDTSEYKFINKEENMYILISDLTEVNYETFISEEYQKVYLEKLQTDYDIAINKSIEKEKNDVEYYLMEGTYNSYDYIIIVTEKEDGIFLTEAQFENNSVYTSKKQEVIDFAISYSENDSL